jgi:hypothetical protein
MNFSFKKFISRLWGVGPASDATDNHSLDFQNIPLSKYIGVHKNERCFIVGNGPSLNDIDMSLLKNEITLGSNRVYLGFEQWGFNFPYWAIVDETQIKQQFENYNEHLPDSMIKFIPRQFESFFVGENYCPIDMVFNPSPFPQFSQTPEYIIDGWTVTYTLLQLAYLMGCNPIYLVGVDYNYKITDREVQSGKWTDEKSKSHFTENYCDADSGTVWNLPRFDKTDLAFACASKFFRENDISIFNATPNSKLGFFPKTDYEMIFKGNRFAPDRNNTQNKKVLLFSFSSDETVGMRALNSIGMNQEIVIVKHKDHRIFPHSKVIEFSKLDLNSLHADYAEIFTSEYFNEAYLSLAGNEANIESILKFFNRLNIPSKKVLLNDRYPQPTLEKAQSYQNSNWVTGFQNIRSSDGKNKTPLYAIIGTFNEEDIIYATVKHAFMQGCEKVFLIDNGSSDNTALEAVEAGATVYRTFHTEIYNELLRICIMNDAIDAISAESGLDEIWWLWLDADEFPEAPEGETLGQFLSRVPGECRIVGGSMVNHFPVRKPYYVPRYHPFQFLPYGELYDPKRFSVPHCNQWHWKHPLHKYVKGKSPIRGKSGFHMAFSNEVLLEPKEHIVIHHFPFRDKDSTYKRYLGLCGKKGNSRNAYNDQTSPVQKSAITKRFENLENIYSEKWGKVFINPGVQSSKNPAGIELTEWTFQSPIWYKPE